MSFGARAVIRLDALTANFETLRRTVPHSRVIAAVKANAYGHGIVTVSRALPDSDAFAVARLSEALKLRAAGIDNGIVLMGGVADRAELEVAAAERCDLIAHTEAQVALLECASVSPLRVWLKIDTGMNRLGVRPREAPVLIDRLRDCNSVGDLGLMTHLANADDVHDATTKVQLERFARLANGFDGDISIANSAALLGWVNHVADRTRWGNRGDLWIRPGIALYGISPLIDTPAHALGLRPVMQFETTLIAVKPIEKGECVGYGGTWQAGRDSILGIAAAGYGDGYPRFLPSGTPVLVNGRRVPLAGAVSMDLLAVDLGPDASDAIGDPVVLWGDGLPVEEVAGYANTNAYPLVTGVIDREGRLQ